IPVPIYAPVKSLKLKQKGPLFLNNEKSLTPTFLFLRICFSLPRETHAVRTWRPLVCTRFLLSPISHRCASTYSLPKRLIETLVARNTSLLGFFPNIRPPRKLPLLVGAVSLALLVLITSRVARMIH